MKQPGVYILQSLKNDSYYIGSTEDMKNRFQEHNNSRVKATKFLIPWEIKLFYKTSTIKEARQLEYKIKKLKSRKIIEKIIASGKITLNFGPLAHLVERFHGMEEVKGSIPLGSTKK
jgi:putative endonuclease